VEDGHGPAHELAPAILDTDRQVAVPVPVEVRGSQGPAEVVHRLRDALHARAVLVPDVVVGALGLEPQGPDP
jgi:hypothetical protein